MGTADKLKKTFAGSGNRNFKKQTNIFYKFEDGSNILRLVGEPLDVRTHYIAPNTKKGDRGLCVKEAFEIEGEERLPFMANCPDWDIENQVERKEKTCPICKLNRIVKEELYKNKENLAEKDAKYLEEIKRATNVAKNSKFNVIDRENPEVLETKEDGTEVKVKGYKVASFGKEAGDGIVSICNQLEPVDPASINEGVDIDIVKGNNGARTTYTAKCVMNGLSVKQTPLTADEKAMQLHDLLRISGKITSPENIIKYMHEDLLALLNGDKEEGESKENFKKSSPVKENKPLEKKEVKKEVAVPFDEEEKTEEAGDFKPECFGDVDPEHPECKKCECFDKCKVESPK
jgi:hypothetical protein